MIANISSDLRQLEETVSTLQYATVSCWLRTCRMRAACHLTLCRSASLFRAAICEGLNTAGGFVFASRSLAAVVCYSFHFATSDSSRGPVAIDFFVNTSSAALRPPSTHYLLREVNRQLTPPPAFFWQRAKSIKLRAVKNEEVSRAYLLWLGEGSPCVVA